MISEVETYFTEIEKIRREHDAEIAEARRTLITNKRGTAREEGEKAFNAKANALHRVTEARNALARAQMGLSDDKIVSWILNNCGSYPDHCDTVLKALPLDVSGLRKLCADHGWCDEFGRYMSIAIRAGIIDDGRSPARRDLEDWLARNYSMREPYLSQFTTRLDAVIAAEAVKAPQPEPVAEPAPEPVLAAV